MYDMDKLNTEIVLVTPTMAKALRESCHYERQRPLSEPHIVRLAREMEREHFISGTQIHLCKVGEKLFIVNGNHTLEAVIASGATLPLTFLYTKCKTMAEVGKIYARHDSGRNRDWAASLRATGMYETGNVSVQMANALGAALKYILLEFQAEHSRTADVQEIRFSRDLRTQKMGEYMTQAAQYQTALAGASAQQQLRLRRAPVMATALETLRYQSAKAMDFWSSVARNDGLRTGDPRRTLVNYLIEKTGESVTERYDGPRAVAVCWNAFFEGRELSRIKPGEKFVLLGTPWDAPKPVAPAVTKPARQLLKTGKRTDAAGHEHAEVTA